jgi:hypothetical protein
VKYKISLALGLLTSAITLEAALDLATQEKYLLTTASLGSNAFLKATNGQAYTNWLNHTKSHRVSGKSNIYNQQIKNNVLDGSFNNALYQRMLSNEVWAARCATGASFFLTSDVNPVLTRPTTATRTSTSDYSSALIGNMQPGGIDNTIVNTFFTQACRMGGDLRTARAAMTTASNRYNGVSKAPPNPLETFKGVILLLDAKALGDIVVGDNMYFGNTQLFIPAETLSSNKQTVSVSLSGQLQGTTKSFVDLTLNAWPNGMKFNNKFFPSLFRSITGKLLGGSIEPINIFQPGYANGKTFIQFFKNAPNNPWALVIKVTASTDKLTKKVTPVANILAMVQLNPTQYAPPHVSNLQSLLASDYNNSLYNLTNKPSSPQATSNFCTYRLLRGIANGYLTSWSYKPLVAASGFLKPVYRNNPTWLQRTYRTPTNFNDQGYSLYHAMYGTKTALSMMHIPKNAFKDLEAIIANPTRPTSSGYIGSKPGTSYQSVLKLTQPSNATTAHYTPKNKIHRFMTKLINPIKTFIKTFVRG